MSRGLGTAQKLILTALLDLEREDGPGDRFYVWAIVDRAYSLSQEMQDRERERREAHERQNQRIRDRAAAGDEKASLYLALGQGLRRTHRHPRARRTSPWWEAEVNFNPSRVLASLARRGLVDRRAVQGGGSAGLTEEGRALARSL